MSEDELSIVSENEIDEEEIKLSFSKREQQQNNNQSCPPSPIFSQDNSQNNSSCYSFSPEDSLLTIHSRDEKEESWKKYLKFKNFVLGQYGDKLLTIFNDQQNALSRLGFLKEFKDLEMSDDVKKLYGYCLLDLKDWVICLDEHIKSFDHVKNNDDSKENFELDEKEDELDSSQCYKDGYLLDKSRLIGEHVLWKSLPKGPDEASCPSFIQYKRLQQGDFSFLKDMPELDEEFQSFPLLCFALLDKNKQLDTSNLKKEGLSSPSDSMIVNDGSSSEEEKPSNISEGEEDSESYCIQQDMLQLFNISSSQLGDFEKNVNRFFKEKQREIIALLQEHIWQYWPLLRKQLAELLNVNKQEMLNMYLVNFFKYFCANLKQKQGVFKLDWSILFANAVNGFFSTSKIEKTSQNAKNANACMANYDVSKRLLEGSKPDSNLYQECLKDAKNFYLLLQTVVEKSNENELNLSCIENFFPEGDVLKEIDFVYSRLEKTKNLSDLIERACKFPVDKIEAYVLMYLQDMKVLCDQFDIEENSADSIYTRTLRKESNQYPIYHLAWILKNNNQKLFSNDPLKEFDLLLALVDISESIIKNQASNSQNGEYQHKSTHEFIYKILQAILLSEAQKDYRSLAKCMQVAGSSKCVIDSMDLLLKNKRLDLDTFNKACGYWRDGGVLSKEEKTKIITNKKVKVNHIYELPMPFYSLYVKHNLLRKTSLTPYINKTEETLQKMKKKTAGLLNIGPAWNQKKNILSKKQQNITSAIEECCENYCTNNNNTLSNINHENQRISFCNIIWNPEKNEDDKILRHKRNLLLYIIATITYKLSLPTWGLWLLGAQKTATEKQIKKSLYHGCFWTKDLEDYTKNRINYLTQKQAVYQQSVQVM